jgi:putative YhdH/YhfP family quinone oxidoreductase
MNPLASPFKAFLISEEGGRTSAAFVDLRGSQLDAGEVLLRVAYSSVNYKDALAATGAGRIVRRFPCVGGIDMAGTVLESADPRFAKGDAVIATSFDLGVAHHGGYAEYARVPADWVVPLPRGMSSFESMALGTAGFTAALGIQRLEDNGLRPGQGPVAVTGASGGVGSLAVDILARLGHHVVAITGKDAEHDYLRRLGAKEVVSRHGLDMGKRPLEKSIWAGAYDTVGGEPLAWLTRTMQQGASIAACGLTAGPRLETTVMPFILRGNSLLGVDSGYWPMPGRQRIWERLATDLRPGHLAEMTRTIRFDELPGTFPEFLAARVRGRIVVDLAA